MDRAANEDAFRELPGLVAVGIGERGHVEGVGDVEDKGPNGAGYHQALRRKIEGCTSLMNTQQILGFARKHSFFPWVCLCMCVWVVGGRMGLWGGLRMWSSQKVAQGAAKVSAAKDIVS